MRLRGDEIALVETPQSPEKRVEFHVTGERLRSDENQPCTSTKRILAS